MSIDAYFKVPTPLTGLEEVATQDLFDSVMPANNTAGREDTLPVFALSPEITAPRDTSSTNDDDDEQANCLLASDDAIFTDGRQSQQGDDLAII